jgi:hypothetical protein
LPKIAFWMCGGMIVRICGDSAMLGVI